VSAATLTEPLLHNVTSVVTAITMQQPDTHAHALKTHWVLLGKST